MTEETKTYPDPLPSRFDKVREKRALLNNGIVLQPTNELDSYDISNAAQSIIAGPVLEKVMDRLDVDDFSSSKKSFHQDFREYYYNKIQEYEMEAWNELAVDSVSVHEQLLDKLPPIKAASISLQLIHDYEMAVSSRELFPELSLHAQVYEQLLRNKLGNNFTYDYFYQCLENFFPTFISSIIALDPVVSQVYRVNAPAQDRSNPDAVDYFSSILDQQFYYLDDSDRFKVKPKFIQLLKRVISEQNITEDELHRKENRGCPFLHSSIHKEYIDFAIKEFITQHKKFFGDEKT